MSWIAMDDRRRRLATVLVALGSLASPLWAAPEVSFETGAVVISGATVERWTTTVLATAGWASI